MINDIYVKCFLTLSDTLNFTRTAEALYMSQQAVSKNISKLEEHLGTKLFNRSRHEVELTKNGRIFYSLFSEFERKFEDVLEEIELESNGLKRTLNIGYQNWLDFGTVPNDAFDKLASSFTNLHSVVSRYNPAYLTNLLDAGKLDIIVIYKTFAPDSSGYNVVPLLSLSRMLMVSDTHPLNKNGADYKVFLKEPYIFDRFDDEKPSETDKRSRACAKAYGLSPKEIIITPNRDSAFTACEQGRGVIISTELNRLADGCRLSKFPMGGDREELVAVWHKEPKDKLVEEYVRLLTNGYKESGFANTQCVCGFGGLSL